MFVKRGKTIVLPCGTYKEGKEIPDVVMARYEIDKSALQKTDPFAVKKEKDVNSEPERSGS
jgi:hypothetical protein